MCKFVKKYKLPLLILYFGINILLFLSKISDTRMYALPTRIIYVILALIIITAIVLIGLIIIKQDNIPVEKIFILIALPLGVMYLLATPLFKGHDEIRQWYKAYALSDGYFMSIKKGNDIGDIITKGAKEIYEVSGVKYYNIKYYTSLDTYKKMISHPDSNKKIFISNKPMAMYPSLQMFPQAVGILIGKTLNVNVYIQALFGRLTNFIFFITLGYFAIKILPVKKLFLAAFFLCPKIMYLATTLSGDVTTITVIILFCAYVLSLMYKRRPLCKKDYIFFCIVLPLIAIFKIIYFPICLLLLLLPKECFKNEDKRFITIGLFLLLTLICIIGWMAISMYFLGKGYANSGAQISYILSHPFTYTLVMIKTVLTSGGLWFLDMIGGYMEYGRRFFLSCIITSYAYIVLYLCFKNEKDKWALNKSERLMSAFIFLVILVLMLTALYVQWTADHSGVGYDVVTGIQGRYFIPLILLMIMAIPWSKKGIKLQKINPSLLYILILGWQLPTLLSIIVRNL